MELVRLLPSCSASESLALGEGLAVRGGSSKGQVQQGHNILDPQRALENELQFF